MLLKDVRQNLWPVGLALLFPFFALLVILFRVGWAGVSSLRIAEGLFIGNLVFVVPLIAFMTGNVLFRAENWALLWTFPVSRARVLLLKHLAGLALTGAAWGVSILSCIGLPGVIPEGYPAWVYGLVLALLYFLGVWVALSAAVFPRGLVLLAAVLTLGFLAAHVLGFRDFLTRAVVVIGPGILAILGAFVGLGLLLGSTVLFFLQRMFAPVRNALLAAGLLLAAGAAAAMLTDAVVSRAFRVTDPGRFTPYRVRMAGPQDLLVLGGNRMFSGEWSRSGPLFHEVPAVLVCRPGQPMRELVPGGVVDEARACDDGRWLAVGRCDPASRTWHLSLFDRDGREHKRIRHEQFAQVEWLPGTHDVYVLDSRSFYRLNADDGPPKAVPLPPVTACGATAHGFRFITGGLLYLRFFSQDAVEVFRCAGADGRWTRVFSEGKPGLGPYGQPFAYRPTGWEGRDCLHLARQDAVVLLDFSGPTVRAHRETVTLGNFNRTLFASPHGILDCEIDPNRLTLRPWGGGEPVWRTAAPFLFRDVFVWKDEALVTGSLPAGKTPGQFALYHLNLRTGALEELKTGSGIPIREDLPCGGLIVDCAGPRTLVRVYEARENRWAWFRVDLEAGTVERVLSGLRAS